MAIVKICLEPQDLLQVFACKGKKKRHSSVEPLSFAFWSGPYESGGQNCQMLAISDGSTQYIGKRRSGKLFLKGHIVNTLGPARGNKASACYSPLPLYHETSHRKYVNEWTRLYPNQAFLIEMNGRLDVACRPQFTSPWSRVCSLKFWFSCSLLLFLTIF